MAKLSPVQRQVLAQIAIPETSVEAAPPLPLATVKALLSRGLIMRSHATHEVGSGLTSAGLANERLVLTAFGKIALKDAAL